MALPAKVTLKMYAKSRIRFIIAIKIPVILIAQDAINSALVPKTVLTSGLFKSFSASTACLAMFYSVFLLYES